MSHVLVYAAALADLHDSPSRLSPEVAQALSADLPYARFGAFLADLGDFSPDPRRLVSREERAPFVTLYHCGAPVGVGLRMIELVSQASMVSRSAGMALIAGYFSHLVLDRQLCRPLSELALALAPPGGSEAKMCAELGRLAGLQLLSRREGRAVLGWRGLRDHLRISKRRGLALRGVSQGLSLLVRTATHEVLGHAPSAAQLDTWAHGLDLWARAQASPLGRYSVKVEEEAGLRGKLWDRQGFDLERRYTEALGACRETTAFAGAFLRAGDFSREARDRFLEQLPEGSLL